MSEERSDHATELKSLLATARNIIKQKYRTLHDSKVKCDRELKEKYEPITKSIKELVETKKKKRPNPQYFLGANDIYNFNDNDNEPSVDRSPTPESVTMDEFTDDSVDDNNNNNISNGMEHVNEKRSRPSGSSDGGSEENENNDDDDDDDEDDYDGARGMVVNSGKRKKVFPTTANHPNDKKNKSFWEKLRKKETELKKLHNIRKSGAMSNVRRKWIRLR